jgi:protein-L-isoaspartate(D-aspartate) O-methyltransferase
LAKTLVPGLYNNVIVDHPEEKLLAARHNMVQKHLRQRSIRDEAVLAAFAEVPRERFVPAAHVAEAYADHPLPIGHCQTISQPYVVALMVQELRPQPHHRVLDVGAGSGYQTAILAKLVAHVYAIERIEALTERAIGALASLDLTNVTFCTGDGTLGLPAEAPFDGIICGAAAPSVPDSWIDQLADGGRIVTPTGGAYVQTLVVLEKRGGKIDRRELCDVRFVKLIGQQGWAD